MNLEKTELLIGQDRLQKLKKSNIIVFGVGGVGGYAVEMLARCGVENLTLVDFDVVSYTNLNRQIIALNSTIGKKKVEVFKERIFDINPNCNVQIFDERVVAENVESFFENKNYTFVIDAIDSVFDKFSLIKYCLLNNIKIISALGAGNRITMPKFEVCDIFKTENDGLAKKMRKLLRDAGIKHHNVVCTKQSPIKCEGLGSISYFPAVCGCILSSYVVNNILEEKIGE